MISKSLINQPEGNCPYLGFIDDIHTRMAFPAEQNVCHKCKPLTPPKASHQREFCLSTRFSECPVFPTEQAKPLPKELSFYDSSTLGRSRKVSIPSFIAGSVLLIIIAIWLIKFPPWAPERLSDIGTNTPTIENFLVDYTRTVLITTSTPTVEPTATQLPPTQTSTPVLPHLVETPFGLENKLVVHQVLTGENLTMLAATYNTSVEAIQAINVITDKFMRVNSLLVIPVNQTDVAAYPQFQAVLITEEDTTFEELATQYAVELSLLSQVNLLPEDYAFQIGEWVLIPSKSTTP